MIRLVFLLVGGALIYGASWLHRRNERVKSSWRVITADVVQLTVAQRDNDTSDRWTAVYRYQVAGKDYFGQCSASNTSSVGVSSDCAPGPLQGQTVRIGGERQLAVGDVIEIRVDPKDPAKSHANAELSAVGPLFLAGFGVVFVLVSFFAVNKPH